MLLFEKLSIKRAKLRVRVKVIEIIQNSNLEWTSFDVVDLFSCNIF